MRVLPWLAVASFGCDADGAWTRMSEDGAPSARGGARAVWTGDEMIVWGGWEPVGTDACVTNDPCGPYLAQLTDCTPESGPTILIPGRDAPGTGLHDGARYDPDTDTWRPMAPYLAGGPTWWAHALWIGDRALFVFRPTRIDDARAGRAPAMALYDPAADAWETLRAPNTLLDASYDYHPVWTGTEVFLFGGGDNGAAWNPATGTWREVAPFATPTAVGWSVAAWTGDEVLVWDVSLDPPGGAWDPAANTWRALASEGLWAMAPAVHGAWNGTELVVLMANGGILGGHARVWRYHPERDVWIRDPSAGPGFDAAATFGFLGDRFVLQGRPPGEDAWQWVTGVAGLWNPPAVQHYGLDDHRWLPADEHGAPSSRLAAATGWTGEEWIVWGGGDDPCGEVAFGDGARWTPP